MLVDWPKLEIGNLEPRLPIVQGGMAVRISMAPLAAAVANEGGMGVIAASGIQSEELAKVIKSAKDLTNGIVGVNIMVAIKNFADLVKTAIELKVDFITSGAGFSRDAFKLCREVNIPYIPIVSQESGAVLAEKLGAPAIVLEGGEAGGHLGTDKLLFEILPRIVKAVKIPVIAAGGILHGWDVKKAFELGAKAVQIGTRFGASEESGGAEAWKQAYVNAMKKDITIITTPVGMRFRAVRNFFVDQIEKGRNFKELSKEFEEKTCDLCLKNCNRDKFCILHALERAQEGDIETGLITCGERVEEIKEILSVKEIVKNLIRDYSTSKVGVAEVDLV